MSKNKEYTYLSIRLSRASLRKQKRKDKRVEKYDKYGRSSESTCPDCGGTRVWCCNMWSAICCYDYGTCPCS